jgi:hypothetical protein
MPGDIPIRGLRVTATLVTQPVGVQMLVQESCSYKKRCRSPSTVQVHCTCKRFLRSHSIAQDKFKGASCPLRLSIEQGVGGQVVYWPGTTRYGDLRNLVDSRYGKHSLE